MYPYEDTTSTGTNGTSGSTATHCTAGIAKIPWSFIVDTGYPVPDTGNGSSRKDSLPLLQ